MAARIWIANRGEIALRVARCAADMGLSSVTPFAEDEGDWPARFGLESVALGVGGPAGFLDMRRQIELAKASRCNALHPGYGFLSERADFARAVEAAGLVWIGPTPAQIELFGDKGAARAQAEACGVPIAAGSRGAVTLAEAREFLIAHNGEAIVIKAVGGGGGRGMRIVRSLEDIDEAYRRCASEAGKAFAVEGVYVERFVERARHIEIQIVGDGRNVVALGERDCTTQMRFQKLVEIAPSPRLSPAMRQALTDAALRMARSTHYRSLGTFEFLVDESARELPFVFIEANPRLQVEHTVTEEILGLDLVRLQIAVALGADLPSLGLTPDLAPKPRGYAIQWRINQEVVDAGEARLAAFQTPSGPGVRVDTAIGVGASVSSLYDALLAKLIVRSQSEDFADALRRSRRALAEIKIEGPSVNLALLRALATRPEFESQNFDVGFVDAHLEALKPPPADAGAELVDDGVAIVAPMSGRLVEYCVAAGDTVAAGAPVAVIEAMKMEHLVFAPRAGRARLGAIHVGDHAPQGALLLALIDAGPQTSTGAGEIAVDDPALIRADLRRALDRLGATKDSARPEAVAKRHALGLRTARENIADLCDPDSFVEYGALAVAAQRTRRSSEDLIANTPADGVVTGVGAVNGAEFGDEIARAAVMAYDATVLAGTQGFRGHQKADRLIEVADRNRLPFVLFAEGGGGRPGDVDMPIVAGLHVPTFAGFAALSGKAPLIGVVAGRCFAGNAALLGCCDVIVAAKGANIGMGGPAMVEGGGLGKFKPEEIGPSDVQAANGVIDLLVADEREAVAAARKYLSYFQGRRAHWHCADPRELRAAVPENRSRVYDMRALMRGLVDIDELLELRAGFGRGIFTALGRIEGRPIGLIANNPAHLGGAIDADAADKAARFLQMCNAHALPIVSLVDTPGFMVGPDIEAKAQVRHVSRLFVASAALRTPFFAVVVRKGYGLGAMAMTAGGFHSPDAIASWPSGEFGGMGLEGAVRLGYRRELDAASSPAEREALFRKLLAQHYEAGGALNMAATLEIDAVIDPADTRAWLTRGLATAKTREPRKPTIDAW